MRMRIYSLFLIFLMIFTFYLGKYAERPTLVMPSDPQDAGLGCHLVSLIGFLNYCNKHKIDSFKVDFSKGVYSHKELGPNWWQYFFKPIEKDSTMAKIARFLKCTRYKKIAAHQIQFFNNDTEFFMTRTRGAQLVKQYIHLKPDIAKELETFKEKYFKGHTVIGVHYRGTDKKTEAPPVPFKKVAHVISRTLENLETETKIFVATDSQSFLDFIEESFPGLVIKTDAIRSQDEKPLHLGDHTTSASYRYLQGKETVIDAWLLGQTDFLIRTSSYLSLFSTLLNPEQPGVLLNDRYPALPRDLMDEKCPLCRQ